MKIGLVGFSSEWARVATQTVVEEGIEIFPLDSVKEISEEIDFSLLLWNAEEFPEKNVLWGVLFRTYQGWHGKTFRVLAAGAKNVWLTPLSEEELLCLLKNIREEYGGK